MKTPRSSEWIRYSLGIVALLSVLLVRPHHSLQALTDMGSMTGLFPTNLATHVAANDGAWSSPATWQDGAVPGSGAWVYIPAGKSVVYDTESKARIRSVRVDGFLQFPHDRNTHLIVDTFLVMDSGELRIGSLTGQPVQDDKRVLIEFDNTSTIDRGFDPNEMGRGLVSHGRARIYGADKLDFVALTGDALKGSRELSLSLPSGMTTPLGWRIGDQLVLGGTATNFQGSNADNTRHQDEVLIITAINGNRISFTNTNIASGDTAVLKYDHKRPAQYVADYNLKLYVANTTRNVVFQSESGPSTATKRRGHVMFMMNPDVVVTNAGFYSLGRTDKSILLDDVGTNANGRPGGGTNVRGRYALHFHRTGAADINGVASVASGNAIVGSPGWGIAHHESNAILESNVVFDVTGAGFMSEAGNELGAWRNNISIKTKDGINWTEFNSAEIEHQQNYDLGSEGDGFWIQGSGSGLEITDNVAISSEGAAVDFLHSRDPGARTRAEPKAARFPVKNLTPELQAALGKIGLKEVDIAVLPVRKFSGFQAYNCYLGMSFYGVSRNEDGQGSFSNVWNYNLGIDTRSHLDNFQFWSLYGGGIAQGYTDNIDFTDGLIVSQPSGYLTYGIYGNSSSVNHRYRNIRVDGFPTGLRVPADNAAFATITTPVSSSLLENSVFLNNEVNFGQFESRDYPDGSYSFPDYFQVITSQFQPRGNNVAPTANFTSTVAGGLAQAFDASSSFDGDSGGSTRPSNASIVSYGWDFNNDGQIDKFGRQVKHVFGQAGSKTVTLTVWDKHGAVGSTQKSFNVALSSYPNLIVDADFSGSDPFMNSARMFNGGASDGPDFLSSGAANYGWEISPSWSGVTSWTRSNGAAVVGSQVDSPSEWFVLGQVIRDDHVRRGPQQFRIEVRNTQASGSQNCVTLRVWGINGEFRWDNSGPATFDALPEADITKLLEQSVGGATFDWTQFNFDLDFAHGYQFILVQAVPYNINPGGGDYFALDNLSISGAAVIPPGSATPTATTTPASFTAILQTAQNLTFAKNVDSQREGVLSRFEKVQSISDFIRLTLKGLGTRAKRFFCFEKWVLLI